MSRPKYRNLRPLRFNPVGSLYNYPNWRYILYRTPERARNIPEFSQRVPEENAGCLTRYTPVLRDVREGATVLRGNSGFFRQLLTKLPSGKKTQLLRVHKKYLKRNKEKAIHVPRYSGEARTWNGRVIDTIQDPLLKRLLLHTAYIKHDRHIEFALQLYHDPTQKRIFSHLGYLVFLNLSDAKIAHRLRLWPKQVEAVRGIFFDFTHIPRDPISRSVYFKQLRENNIIDDEDRRYYKVLGSLGELALKVEADPANLTDEERHTLQSFFADSLLESTSALYFSITSKKDSEIYNQLVMGIAALGRRAQESELLKAKVRNLNAQTEKLINEREDYGTSLSPDDSMALDQVKLLSRMDGRPPEPRSISDLLAEEPPGSV